MAAPPVPTGLHPRDVVTVTTNTPVITVNIQRGVGEDLRVKAHFKLATDSGFTANVREWTQPDSKFDNGGTHRANVPKSLALFQGTWYVTAYAVQETTALESDPSATYSFVVDHPIQAVADGPVANAVVDLNASAGVVRHRWHFTDPEPLGRQTKFQVIVEKLDATAVHDSGTVTSTAGYYDETDSATYPDEDLRWNVYLWDEDDIQGPPSDWAVYKPSAGGSLTLDTPSGTITDPAPTVSWTYTPVGGRAQVAYQVAVYEADLLLYYTGFVASTATSFVLPGATLKNGHTYTIAVFVQDAGGVVVQQSGSFAVAFTPPATATTSADASGYFDGSVIVNWSGTPDGDFVFWRVYRKLTIGGDSDWIKISPDMTSSGTSSFQDYSAPSNSDLDYAAVQVKSSAGALVESVKSPASVTTVSVPEYWLVDVDPEGIHMRLSQVTDEEFSDEIEQEEMLIIGRGRRIEQGTEWGYRGTVTAQLFNIDGGPTAREQRLIWQSLKRTAGACFLRNPFGDSWRVVPGDIAVSRMAGVGENEYCTVTIPYAEVY